MYHRALSRVARVAPSVMGSGASLPAMGLGRSQPATQMGLYTPARGSLLTPPRAYPTPLWSPPTRMYSSESQRVWKESFQSKVEKVKNLKNQLKMMYSTENHRVWKESFGSKVETMKNLKNELQLYLCQALKASVSLLKTVAEKVWYIINVIAKHVANEVTLGFQALVSASYLYFFVLGVFGTTAFIARQLNLLDDIEDLDKWEAWLKDLLHTFPEKLVVGMLYFDIAIKVLRESFEVRKTLKEEMTNLHEAMKETAKELKSENMAIKAELLHTQEMLKEARTEVDELREVISKTVKSPE